MPFLAITKIFAKAGIGILFPNETLYAGEVTRPSPVNMVKTIKY